MKIIRLSTVYNPLVIWFSDSFDLFEESVSSKDLGFHHASTIKKSKFFFPINLNLKTRNIIFNGLIKVF